MMKGLIGAIGFVVFSLLSFAASAQNKKARGN
jgi:hypothetical protein